MRATFVFLAAMELVKLFMIASYAFLAVGGSFPFFPASIAFFFALALGRFLRRKGMRVVFYVLFESVAFAASFAAIYAAHSGAPFDFAAILPRDEGQAISFVSVLAASAIFWIRAMWLEAKQVDHEFCAIRFDEGLALFLAAFCITALVHVENRFIERLVIPYFIFGILTLGMSKVESAHRGGLAPSSRKALVASVAVVFVLAAAALLLLVPSLTEPARLAVETFKGVSLDLLRILERLLKWLFRPRAPRFADPGQGGGQAPLALPPAGDEGSPFSRVLMWIVLGAGGSLLLLLVGYLLFLLFRLLARRTKKPEEASGPRSFRSWLAAFLGAWAAFFARLFALATRRAGNRSAALAAYARLLAGGRAAGLARKPSETPREYSRRLAVAFPGAAGQAEFVAEAVELEVYGGRAADGPTVARLTSLRSRTSRSAFLAERLRRAARKADGLKKQRDEARRSAAHVFGRAG